MEQQLRDLLGPAFHSLTRTPVGHEARAQISGRSAGASLVAAEATEAYALALLALIGARSGGVDGRRTGQQVRGVTSAEPAGPAGRRILAGVDGSDDALRARALSDQGGGTPSEGACGSSTSPTPARSSPGMWYLVVTTEALQQAGSTIVAEAVEVATGLGLPAERVTSGWRSASPPTCSPNSADRQTSRWWDAAR